MNKEEIKNSTSKFRGLITHSKKLDRETMSEIKDLINILNRIIVHNERERL